MLGSTEAVESHSYGPLRNITCRPYRLRRNCIRDGSSRQRRAGVGRAENDKTASILAFVSRSTSAYTFVVSIETCASRSAPAGYRSSHRHSHGAGARLDVAATAAIFAEWIRHLTGALQVIA
jgi:hypothetical protein